MKDLVRDARFALGMLLSRPFDCLLQVTNRCNMKCSFCDFWPNTDRANELTLAQFQSLSSQLSRLGNFLVSIEGGEPFVRQDLVEIVRAFSKDHVPAIFTNGWYVNRQNATALFEAGLASCSVSIDYPEADRHDAKRCIPGATARAWEAVDHLVAAAPRGGKQVNVISVVMEDNWRDLERLLQQSRERGVGHLFTLLSVAGHRRGRSAVDRLPPPEAAAALVQWWKRYPHLRYFQDYFSGMQSFLAAGPMPVCRAGVQTFNIDHVGNVAPCIERIDSIYGNIKSEPLAAIHRRMADDRTEISRCQDCWTACRGMGQAMGGRGGWRAWRDLLTRMKSS